MPRYTIRENRIKSGAVTGFIHTEENQLVFDRSAMYHILLLKGLDSAVDDSSWGRLSFKAVGDEDIFYAVYVLAIDNAERAEELDRELTDKNTGMPERLSVLKKKGAKRHLNSSDFLLYEMKGRFLYVALEAFGTGDLRIDNIVIDTTGDNFMAAFPEVYRERGSFFHRFMSVFSSIYNDFQRDINEIHRVLDLDTCSEELLVIYAGWLGLTLREGLFPIDVTRELVRQAYELNRIKGTREAIERVLMILLKEKPVIIEHNQIKEMLKKENSIPPQFEVRGIYDVTIIIKKQLTEELLHQITFLVDQFKPVMTRISVSQMDERPTADSNSYLDVNTVLPGTGSAIMLDSSSSLDGTVILK